VVSELVIGHRQQGLRQVYDLHRYDNEKREALDKWERTLLTIVNPSTRAPTEPVSNVVAMRR
jgi:hypothetical protein